MWTTEYNIVEVPFDKGHLNPGRRVETPKDNGKMHLLGTPTVVDRLVQQAINQVLTPIYEKQFSHWSFGFRPGKGCHDALRGAQRIVDEGYKYVVDLVLERFFGTVCHSRLIEILGRTIKDGRVVSLIHKYLRSGVISHGLFESSDEGTPQGCPELHQAYMWGNTSLAYWQVSLSPILLTTISKANLKKAGYPFLLDSYLEWHPKQEPPYAERHVLWREKSENEVGGNYYIFLLLYYRDRLGFALLLLCAVSTLCRGL